MFTLNIKVNGRISQICQGDGIVSGSVGIDSVKFITTSEWNTAAKKAVFYIDKNNVYESFLDDNNMAKVPYEVIQDIGILKIGLYGVYDDGTVITASIIEMELKEGYVRGITTAPGKYEDIYTQVLQQYSKIYEEMLCSAGSFSFSEDDNTTPDAVQEISPTVTSKIFTSDIIETNCDFLDIEKKSDSNTYLILNKVSEDESREQFAFAFNTTNDLKERIDVREVSKIEIVIKGKGPYDADPETYAFRKVKLIATALEDLTDKVSKEISEIALIKSDKIYIERSGHVIPDKPSSPSIKSYPTYDGMEYSVDIEEDGNILFYFGFTDDGGNSIKVIPIYSNSGTVTDVDFKTATKVSVLSQRDLNVNITFRELLCTDSFNRYLNEKANKEELDNYVEVSTKIANMSLDKDITSDALAAVIYPNLLAYGKDIIKSYAKEECVSNNRQVAGLDLNEDITITQLIKQLTNTSEGAPMMGMYLANAILQNPIIQEKADKSYVNELISAVSSLDITKVGELPENDISTSTIYLVPAATALEQNMYEEYIYVDGNWEHIGNTNVDLSGYVQNNRKIANIPLSGDISAQTLYNALLGCFNNSVFAGMVFAAGYGTIQSYISANEAVKLNTESRHIHSNKEFLDKLTESAFDWELLLDKTLDASSSDTVILDFNDLDLNGQFEELKICVTLWSTESANIDVYANDGTEPIVTLTNALTGGATYVYDISLKNSPIPDKYIEVVSEKVQAGVKATTSTLSSSKSWSTDMSIQSVEDIKKLRVTFDKGWNNSTERHVYVLGKRVGV